MKLNKKMPHIVARAVGLLFFINLSLPSFAQEGVENLFLSGPKGTVMYLMFDDQYLDQLTFDPQDKVVIYKNEGNTKNRKKIGEVSFPSSAAALRERLGAENTEALMENRHVTNEEALYQKILSEPVDSLGLNLLSMELQYALGLAFLDETWKEGEASHYELEKINAAGAVVNQMSHTVSGKIPDYLTRFSLSEERFSDTLVQFTWSIPTPLKTPAAFPVFGKLLQKEDLAPAFTEVDEGMVSPSLNGDSSHVYYNHPIEKGRAYSFYTVLYDAAGNESPPSDTANILSVTANEVGYITEFRAKADENHINLTWNSLPKRAVYSGIEISKSRTKDSAYVVLDTLNARQVSYSDKQILKGSAYYYRIRPLLLVENTALASPYSEASTRILYSENDPAPSKPSGLIVVPHEAGIKLSWWTPDETDIFGYYVLRGTHGQEMETIGELVQDTVFIDNSFPSDFSGDMKYALLAINQNQQLSDTSAVAALSIRQELALTPPSGLATVLRDDGVALRWNDVTAIDDQVSAYLLFRRKKGDAKFDLVKVPEEINAPFYTDPIFSDASIDRNGVYEYAVATRDFWGNLSGLSNSSEVDLSKKLQLSPPSEVQLRSLSAGIEVSWPTPYEVGDETYVIYRKSANENDFKEIAQVTPKTASYYLDKTVQNDVLYEYNIAVLNQTVASEKSESASIQR